MAPRTWDLLQSPRVGGRASSLPSALSFSPGEMFQGLRSAFREQPCSQQPLLSESGGGPPLGQGVGVGGSFTWKFQFTCFSSCSSSELSWERLRQVQLLLWRGAQVADCCPPTHTGAPHHSLGDSQAQVTAVVPLNYGVAGARLKRRWQSWPLTHGSPCPPWLLRPQPRLLPGKGWSFGKTAVATLSFVFPFPRPPSATSSGLGLAARTPEWGVSWEAEEAQSVRDTQTGENGKPEDSGGALHGSQLFHPEPNKNGKQLSPCQQTHVTPARTPSPPAESLLAEQWSQEVWVTLWPQRMAASCQGHG